MKNKILDTLTITTPCTQNWETMPGDERKRYCGECKLFVHDFSEYSEKEIVELIGDKDLQATRLCARIYRDGRGKLVTNNCPVFLRKYRKRILALKTAIILFLIAKGICSQALAQGLIGAPVDGGISRGSLTIYEEACGSMNCEPLGDKAMTLAAVSGILSNLAFARYIKGSLLVKMLLCGLGGFAIAFVTLDLLNFCTGWAYSENALSLAEPHGPMRSQVQISCTAAILAGLFSFVPLQWRQKQTKAEAEPKSP